MSESAQNRAVKNHRRRLAERGLARFEVLGLNRDRDLIRSVARRLAQDGPESDLLRAAVSGAVDEDAPSKGGILAALLRSPLAGADLQLERVVTAGRKTAL